MFGFYVRYRRQKAGMWRAGYRAGRMASVWGTTFTFLFCSAAGLFVAEGGYGWQWVGLFLSVIVFVVFRSISNAMLSFATVSHSPDIQSIELMNEVRARSETTFHSDQKAKSVVVEPRGQGILQTYFETQSASMNQPLQSSSQKIDHVMSLVDAADDLQAVASGQGSSAASRFLFVLTALYFPLFIYLGSTIFGAPKIVLFLIFQWATCLVLAYGAANATWDWFPPGLRIVGRFTVIFWPLTLLAAWYLWSL